MTRAIGEFAFPGVSRIVPLRLSRLLSALSSIGPNSGLIIGAAEWTLEGS